MTIELDHFIVPSHDKAASAKRLGELLGVRWGEAAAGPFFAVHVNEGLTLDFFETADDFPVHHYCFRVTDDEFDAILERIKAAGIPFRGTVRGPTDRTICTDWGGRSIYWNDPDAHQWEMLTSSYAR
jgi:catechol 2,3-dioxygenase-like lactoylglutathione lyase family enzyme